MRKGIPRERVVPFPRSENFWGPAGETGPCGPCSELHYDRGAAHGCGEPDCGPNCERCDRYIEFWNLVFMEFDLAADGSVTPLPKQNIDTGMGLERCAMLVQETDSIFDTDGFRLIMDWIEAESGVHYGASPEATKAHRVLSDHGRGMTFLVAEGITPSNEGRGYVLRRLIRRSVVQARRIGLPAVHLLPRVVVEQVGPWYPEVVENADEIERVVRAEEERFRETIDRGMREFDELSGRDITVEDAFRLAATYGFPIELTVELARERGQQVDVDGYRARDGAPQGDLPWHGRARPRAAGRRLRARRGVRIGVRRLREGRRAHAARRARGPRRRHVPREAPRVAVLPRRRRTGHRPGLDRARRRPVDARRARGRVPLRRATRRSSSAEADSPAGDRVRAVVPWSVRFPTMANHTATHLLQAALREVLGDHVKQAGSAVRPDKLRFDFTHTSQLTRDERQAIEERVNRAVFANLPVHTFETTLDEARRLGAMALFGEKYGEVVRVVDVPGTIDRALRRHPRPHRRPRSAGSRSSRRGRSAAAHAGSRRSRPARRGRRSTRAPPRRTTLRGELEDARKERKRSRVRRSVRPTRTPQVVAVDGVNVVVQAVDGFEGDALLELSDRIKQRHSPGGGRARVRPATEASASSPTSTRRSPSGSAPRT